MKNDYEITEVMDTYSGLVEYELKGFVDGNFFGILGTFRTEDDAREIGDNWVKIDHSTDARVS